MGAKPQWGEVMDWFTELNRTLDRLPEPALRTHEQDEIAALIVVGLAICWEIRALNSTTQ